MRNKKLLGICACVCGFVLCSSPLLFAIDKLNSIDDAYTVPKTSTELTLSSKPTVTTGVDRFKSDSSSRSERLRKEIELESAKVDKNASAVRAKVLASKSNRFSNMNLKGYTGLTAEQLRKGLKGTALVGIASACVKYGKMYNVNELALAGIAANESSWGTSRLARTKNNLTGWKAYDSNIKAATAFSSKDECIRQLAKGLSTNYLSSRGAYYNGATLRGINMRYASDKEWHSKVSSCMKRIIKKINKK